MGRCVFSSQIVTIIGCNKWDAGFFTHVDEVAIDDLLLGDPGPNLLVTAQRA